ncbi:MAG: bifunctional (p)ppGpp synthetase/guanosine-3',5'-bis(diphosphate) 3'-pyrophosphohydrolase [bacterium]|nr:bifunctional (p)ppGpp synthetase/guanosine-3',5'-bis(diphosphate) 3'-pyrophosphohydrolase [bacterium]
MIRQYELVEKVKSYDKDADEEALNRAYVFAMKAHGTQKRASGDPYFQHPLEVTDILADMKLDTSTLITALLHDTVEDTDVTLDEIEKLFGAEVSGLVDGVTKLSRIENLSDNAKQAENFRKLLLAMSEDIRVLLVKLADRLHNMRTLHFIKSDAKRWRISQETMDIYAPLAERIGLRHIKEELQDLSFAHLNPEARDTLLARLHFLKENGHSAKDKVIEELQNCMKKAGLEVQISGREKTPYSIWRKMRQQNIPFEQLTDIIAFRLMVETLEQCYQALGTIHSQYPFLPNKFKDYISTPKPNGYQSLHTSVLGPNQQRIEIQIRTHYMHALAEHGVAAHWQYKQFPGAKYGREVDPQKYHWLRGLLEILEHSQGHEEFLEHTKLEMFHDQVFCFSPTGDLTVLPQGATPIDFAYGIHSDVGNHCIGAKVNGRMVPLRTYLKNGDQVEIQTSTAQTPSPTWERFVVTGKARSNIRRFVRQQQKDQFVSLGRSILQRICKGAQLNFSDKAFESSVKHFQKNDVEDLLSAVGHGILTGHDVVKHAFGDAFESEPPPKTSPEAAIEKPTKPPEKSISDGVTLQGLIPGMAIHYAKCCHPLPGDRITGIVHTGTGVTIHTRDCNTLKQYEDEPDRWLDVDWGDTPSSKERHVCRLRIVIINRPGGLASLTTTASKNGANILNLKITNRDQEFYKIVLDVEVEGVEHMKNIMGAMRTSPLIHTVDRESHEEEES